jgi:hypothetical protein
MATNKTQPTNLSITSFLAAIEDDKRRADCETLVKLMQKITQQPAVIWETATMMAFSATWSALANTTTNTPAEPKATGF